MDVGPGQGEDFRIFLGDRADWFDAREDDEPLNPGITVIHGAGSFEVHGGSGNDKLYGSSYATPVIDWESGSVEYWYYTEDELYGDRGNDRLYGDLGPDHLEGGPGNDRLNGGEKGEDATGRDDSLRGGSGNDVLWAADRDRDLLIDCGPGRHDKAFIDRQDPKPKRCETVKRR